MKLAELRVRISADTGAAERALRRLHFRSWCMGVAFSFRLAPFGVLDICDYSKSVTTP